MPKTMWYLAGKGSWHKHIRSAENIVYIIIIEGDAWSGWPACVYVCVYVVYTYLCIYVTRRKRYRTTRNFDDGPVVPEPWIPADLYQLTVTSLIVVRLSIAQVACRSDNTGLTQTPFSPERTRWNLISPGTEPCRTRLKALSSFKLLSAALTSR